MQTRLLISMVLMVIFVLSDVSAQGFDPGGGHDSGAGNTFGSEAYPTAPFLGLHDAEGSVDGSGLRGRTSYSNGPDGFWNESIFSDESRLSARGDTTSPAIRIRELAAWILQEKNRFRSEYEMMLRTFISYEVDRPAIYAELFESIFTSPNVVSLPNYEVFLERARLAGKLDLVGRVFELSEASLAKVNRTTWLGYFNDLPTACRFKF